MPVHAGGGLARLVEALARVQTNGLQQAVAALARGSLVGDHEGLLDQTREHVGDARGVEVAAGAHAFDGFEPEAAGEGCEPTKQGPLVRLEEVVTPLEGRLERLLPCRRSMARRAENPEPVVEPLRDRRGTECSEAAGRELECQWQAVES